MSTILLVDDHIILREGLKNLFESEGISQRTLEAGNYAEALAMLREEPPDAVILDINLPGRSGLELLERIRQSHPRLPVLMLSMHAEEQYGLRALRLGASGYLSKNCPPEQLIDGLRAVLAGRRYLTPELSECLLTAMQGDQEDDAPHERLSTRELEILRLIGSGETTASIARSLAVSPSTVGTYRARIQQKTGLRNNAEIIRYTIEHGLTD